jgi:predicted ATP-grasp superfamily ATP-dependent carboligase
LAEGPPALVLGAGLTAVGVLRALGAHAITAYLVAPVRDVAHRSRFARRLPCPSLVDVVAADLPGALAEAGIEHAVLFPCSDRWVKTVAEVGMIANGRYPAPVAPAAALAQLLDKASLARTAERAGVPHPRTVLVRSPEDLNDVDDDTLRRCFLKPVDSEAFNRRFGTKGFPIRDRDTARAQVAEAVGECHTLVLQEIVHGGPADHVFLDGYVDRHGRFAGLYARRRLRMHPPRFGNSTASVTIPLAEVQPAVESFERLVAATAYRGPFDAEFARDERDGAYKLIEVNVRAWWQVGLARACGVDVIRMAYDDALGRPVEGAASYLVGARWVNPIQDLRAIRASRKAGERPDISGWWTAHHGVFAWDDPFPGLAELARVARRARGVTAAQAVGTTSV